MAKTRALTANRDATAIKRTISRGFKSRLRAQGGSVASLARELGTSRTAVQRVLDPENTSITLHTMVKAAHSLGYKVRLELEPRISKIEPVAAPRKVQPLLTQLGDIMDRLP
jgi:transcriptional regulator with XRE-family HTH domain